MEVLDMDGVLALDLGMKTGFAIRKGGEIISGTMKLRHDIRASGVRFLDFRNWVIDVIGRYGIRCVFFERVYKHKGTDAAHVYGAFMYILAMICVEKGIECVGIPVGAIKKVATGKGNASKEEMISAMRAWGFNPVDDNEADALAILFAGLNSLNFQKNHRYCLDNETNGARYPVNSLASEIF
jgi:Holliday junction resolvasome RuvABC endonuclease subunit